jgi:hypothetical protein
MEIACVLAPLAEPLPLAEPPPLFLEAVPFVPKFDLEELPLLAFAAPDPADGAPRLP